jgi:hypothetical protein
MGKRPALLCRELAECKADLEGSCILLPNTTAEQAPVTVADLDTCSLNGAANGPLVPGMFAWNDSIPDLGCTTTQPCTMDGFRCSYAAARMFCTCSGGVDTCVPLGECYETTCARCQDCLTKTNVFVQSQVGSKDAGATAAAWVDYCASSLTRATVDDCRVVQTAVAASPHGNLGKRAAALCSLVKCMCSRIH